MLSELSNTEFNITQKHDTAIIDYKSGEATYYTFDDLNQNADYVASGLKHLQLPKKSNIAIVALNSFSFLSTYIGIRRAGHTAVLINYKLSNEQINSILQETQTVLIFHDNEFRSKFNNDIKKIIFDFNYEKFLVKKEFSTDGVETGGLILYTGGSTGTSKGVVISSDKRKWTISAITSKEKYRTIISAPICHQSGLSALESKLSAGVTVVLLPKFEPEQFVNAMVHHRVVGVSSQPSMMAMILDRPELTQTPFKRVRSVSLSSAPTSPELFRRISRLFPNAEVLMKYGSTETGPAVFARHPYKPRPLMSVGYPKPNYQYKLVNEVLHIKTESMLTTYFGNSKKLESVLDDEGYYITGDKFRVDEDGFYYFLGRGDDMFVCGGENIYPNEVEEILDQHPKVIDSVVVGVEDDIKGMKPYAFVRTINNFKDEKALIDYTLENAPAYMHPRRIWFLDNFPLTVTNKIDIKLLEEIAKENLE
jgi:long-chain acyl-CoA synthetase